MSKERELLQKVLYTFSGDALDILCCDIRELLAQPEHIPDVGNMVEQEPVAWIDDGCNGLIKQIKTNRVFYQEGYAQAELDLKREPSGLKIMDVCGSEDYREGFKDGALYAEEYHGIGVDNE
jgi:hypothetical protein